MKLNVMLSAIFQIPSSFERLEEKIIKKSLLIKNEKDKAQEILEISVKWRKYKIVYFMNNI